MTGVPSQVRHYWRGSLSLSDLDGPAVTGVIEDLMQERRDGLHRRAFGRRYMDLRRRTEAKMLDLFLQAGGQPERTAPHYFVLGESVWFRDLAEDMKEVVLDLCDLPETSTSFTYPDSFTAMGFAPDFGLPYEAKPYHQQVFRLGDLDRIIESYGVPPDATDDYDGYQSRPFEQYIEVQLWSDDPIAHLLPAIS